MILKNFLNIVVNHLIEDISIKILDKCKFENDDSVIVNDGIKLFYKIFNIFRRNN
jgi:hypothetical protein